jgi:hypothetical protein
MFLPGEIFADGQSKIFVGLASFDGFSPDEERGDVGWLFPKIDNHFFGLPHVELQSIAITCSREILDGSAIVVLLVSSHKTNYRSVVRILYHIGMRGISMIVVRIQSEEHRG